MLNRAEFTWYNEMKCEDIKDPTNGETKEISDSDDEILGSVNRPEITNGLHELNLCIKKV